MAFPFSHLASVGCSISQTKLAQNAGWSLSSNVAVMWDFAGKESKSAEFAANFHPRVFKRKSKIPGRKQSVFFGHTLVSTVKLVLTIIHNILLLEIKVSFFQARLAEIHKILFVNTLQWKRFYFLDHIFVKGLRKV